MSDSVLRNVIRTQASRWLWAGAMTYTLLLTYLLLAPHPLWFLGKSGEEAEEAVDQTLADYVQHAAAYGILGAVLITASASGTGPRAGVCLGLAAMHGVICECLQAYIPHRYFGIYDALANLVGVVAGGLVALIVWRMVKNWNETRRSKIIDPDEPLAQEEIRVASD